IVGRGTDRECREEKDGGQVSFHGRFSNAKANSVSVAHSNPPERSYKGSRCPAHGHFLNRGRSLVVVETFSTTPWSHHSEERSTRCPPIQENGKSNRNAVPPSARPSIMPSSARSRP